MKLLKNVCDFSYAIKEGICKLTIIYVSIWVNIWTLQGWRRTFWCGLGSWQSVCYQRCWCSSV